MLGDITARLRGYQSQALQLMSSGRHDVLIVQPTGGGKSLLYLLLGTLERDRSTVVVLPFISLIQDITRRCEEQNVEVTVWGPQMMASKSVPLPGLVLVSVEHASKPSFAKFFLAQYELQILRRIIIDECHLIPFDGTTYRHMMKDLNIMRAVPVPIVLLTATLPPGVSEIVAAMTQTNPITLRAPSTAREMIEYEVN